MKFQKIVSVFMIVALCVSFAACRSSDSSGETGTDPVSTVGSTGTTAPETTVSTKDPAEFREIVLVDDENCTVTVKSVKSDGLFGYTLQVFLENKTDVELMFTVDDVSVNGYMCDPFWASTVSAGKKANEEISFSESDFEVNDIAQVEDITFTLKVYDSNNWEAEDLVNQIFTVNP